MTLKTHAQAKRYTAKLAKLMGLSEWTIHVSTDPPEDNESAAEVYCVYGRKYALIRLSVNYYRCSATEQRQVICHELLHCHHAHADRQVLGQQG